MLEPLESWNSEATRQSFHDGTFENWVLGRKVQKHRFDLMRYRRIVSRMQPQVIVETGTRWGGSAGYFAETARVPVMSIDIDPKLGWTAKNRDQADRGISYIVGSSTHEYTIDLVKQFVGEKRALVVLDSDHHAAHVRSEIELYGGLLKQGDTLVVEDACFDMWEDDDSRRGGSRIPEDGGPLKALRDSGIAESGDWRRLDVIEGMYEISHSPCGWWQRR